MDCKDCKGLSLFRDKKEVLIEEDSCYKGTLKVIYAQRLMFDDGTSILCNEDVLFCADKDLLLIISNAIDTYLKRNNDDTARS